MKRPCGWPLNFHCTILKTQFGTVVVCMNNATSYPIVFNTLKKNEYAQFDHILIDGIRIMFKELGVMIFYILKKWKKKNVSVNLKKP